MKRLLYIFIISLTIVSCSSDQTKNLNKNSDTIKLVPLKDTSFIGLEPFQSDTVSIGSKTYVLTAYKNDTTSFFIVQKLVNGQFKTIMKDPDFGTNNSSLFFQDQNNDGYLDIVWTKKWQDHSYLFNPTIENFVEVGEFHSINILKVDNKPILYKNKFPVLFYWNEEKPIMRASCGDDTMFLENHSELFTIDEHYNKISFAVLDNFSTLDYDNLECGEQIITCYVPPYFGKFGDNSIWNNGNLKDSFLLKRQASFFKDENFAIDSSYIADYWKNNYKKYLQFGQIFRVGRNEQIEYYK